MHCDRWLAAPQWGLRHLLSWALQFGLDYFNVHTDFAADSSHWAQFEWYNLWAGAVKQPLSTPGAFVIFHDGLDASGQKLFLLFSSGLLKRVDSLPLTFAFSLQPLVP